MAAWRNLIPLLTAAALSGALLLPTGCDEEAGADIGVAEISGETFFLELALDDEARYQGLSGRTHIEEDGGMLFIFPRSMQLAFVMRHCSIPIDVAFLDGAGRVVALHEMQPEPPQQPDEPDWEYEQRLKQYPSRFPAQMAIELRDGRLEELDVEEGDRIRIHDLAALKRRAK